VRVIRRLRHTTANHIKLSAGVLGVEDGAPILAEDHPVYADMAKPMKRAYSVSDLIQMMSLTPTVCCRSLLECCSFRRCYPSLGGYHRWGP
jgi:hypothetical protein